MAVSGGLAFAGVGFDRLVVVDMASGTVLNTVTGFFDVDDLTRRLATVGFRVMFTSVWGSVTVDDVAPGILQSRMDGVIIASIDEADRLGEMCFRAGAGVVLFNRSSKTSDVLSSVRSDNVEGGRAVANFIVDRGYARPAFIAGVEHISTSQEREQGLPPFTRKERVDQRLPAGRHGPVRRVSTLELRRSLRI